MIKDIFIPTSLGGYYIIPQRILGIEIIKTRIRATQLYAQGKTVTLEKFVEIGLEADTVGDHTERVRAALNNLAKEVDKPDVVRTTLSSALVITKELTVPFTEPEKIRLMLPFELEGHIPFPLSDAITDFIVISVDQTAQTTTILTMTVQKQHIVQHLAYFQDTPLNPTTIGVDIVDLYGLYVSLPNYAASHKAVVIADINMHSTRLACIVDAKLRLIRTLPKGLISIAGHVAKKLDQSNAKTLEDIIRFGLEGGTNEASSQALQEALKVFWQDVQLTLQSFTAQLNLAHGVETVILVGDITTIPGILAHTARMSTIPTELFATQDLITHGIVAGVQNVPPAQLLSLACAYPSAIATQYNLRQEEFAAGWAHQTALQLAVGATLALSIIGLLAGYSFYTTQSLTNKLKRSERNVTQYLEENQLAESGNIDDAFEEAEQKVQEEEKLWFAFSRQRRFSFVEHLQKLSETVDRASLGLDLKKLIISQNAIIFDGKVKDYEALKAFERELQNSNLFAYIPPLQETTFANVSLVLRKNNEALP
jgi:type IV pilus assembly protein PilM